MLQRNRKPLSPISRSALPVSAQPSHNNSNEGLEIHGRNIIPGQSSKQSVSNISSDYSAGNSKTRKKKDQSKLKS